MFPTVQRSIEEIKKLKILKQHLSKIKRMKKVYYKKFKKYKSINTCSKIIINLLNALTVSSLVLTFSGAVPVIIVSIVSSSLSSLGSVALNTFDMDAKIHSANTTYLQLDDLFNTYYTKIYKKDISDSDLNTMLNELNNKLGLIQDNALPISMNSSERSI